MPSARLVDGVDSFLRRCRTAGDELFIVSHKTEYGHYDPDGINLREAARRWMIAHGFFRDEGYGLRPDHVYFEGTRREKLERIAELTCDVFIDDLEEVLLDPAFPHDTRRVLYTQSASIAARGVVQCRTWAQIADYVFNERW
jgi:hypothetical protein